MNSTSNIQRSRPHSPYLTSLTTTENSRLIERSSRKWLLVPIIAAPLMLVASSYYFSNTLQANQTPRTVGSESAETQTSVEPSFLELQLAQAQREESEQKYQATREQLQAIRDQHAELQIAYQDASDRMESLNHQNQQLRQLAAERSVLKAQLKQLQGFNGKLSNQVQGQKLQLTTLQNRFNTLENQKQQIESENQQLKLANTQLVTLKSELTQAHQAIEQLSTQLSKNPDEMETITVNGKQ
ncbi:MAG: hypothetical protein ICV63_09135, partial [Coleofasciculus sp. Co-bin14]|nr:hypothetical protein [Coleofasciculus sp. Co-bin14]